MKEKTAHYKPHARNQDGFTLIDVSIMLLVAGIIATPFLHQYKQYLKQSMFEETEADIAAVDTALTQFYFDNDRYPCPADPLLGSDDAEFGQENFNDEGECEGGPNTNDDVAYGAVPFKALNLTYKQSLDKWRNKLTYAVTLSQTNAEDYDPNEGKITIIQPQFYGRNPDTGEVHCQDNEEADVETDNVHLVLLSHGRTGAGAYDYNGTQVASCPDSGATADMENCDDNDTFLFHICERSTSDNINFYDDIMYANYNSWLRRPVRTWGENGNDLLSDIGYIGVGTATPERTLDVAGNIKASPIEIDGEHIGGGNAVASKFCDSNGRNCFDPRSIAGYDPRLSCSGASGLRQISYNRARCVRTSKLVDSEGRDTDNSDNKCADGQYVIGFEEGRVICSAP